MLFQDEDDVSRMVKARLDQHLTASQACIVQSNDCSPLVLHNANAYLFRINVPLSLSAISFCNKQMCLPNLVNSIPPRTLSRNKNELHLHRSELYPVIYS